MDSGPAIKVMVDFEQSLKSIRRYHRARRIRTRRQKRKPRKSAMTFLTRLLVVRAYWPKIAVIDGSWTPPAVEKQK